MPFLREGSHFVPLVAVNGLAADWAIVAAWLGCEGGDLCQDDYEKFGLVFRSYLARGVAPSVPLKELFKKFAQMAKSEAWPVVPVPQELVPVLKRMMANDHDIQQKRANHAARFAAALKSLTPPPSRPGAEVQVTGSAVYVVVQKVNRRQYWPWIMGGVAILFNPILPISFTREEWQPIDFGVAVIF